MIRGRSRKPQHFYRAFVSDIGEFPVSTAILAEIDLSQNDDPIIIRESSFVFLDKDVFRPSLIFVLLLFQKEYHVGDLSL